MQAAGNNLAKGKVRKLSVAHRAAVRFDTNQAKFGLFSLINLYFVDYVTIIRMKQMVHSDAAHLLSVENINNSARAAL